MVCKFMLIFIYIYVYIHVSYCMYIYIYYTLLYHAVVVWASGSVAVLYSTETYWNTIPCSQTKKSHAPTRPQSYPIHLDTGAHFTYFTRKLPRWEIHCNYFWLPFPGSFFTATAVNPGLDLFLHHLPGAVPPRPQGLEPARPKTSQIASRCIK